MLNPAESSRGAFPPGMCAGSLPLTPLTSTFMAQAGDFSRSNVDLTRTNVRAPMTYSVRWHGPLGGRLRFASSSRIETARDKCAIRRDQSGSGDCLQVSRPQREGELFCLALLRPEPDGAKAVRPTSAAKNAEQG